MGGLKELAFLLSLWMTLSKHSLNKINKNSVGIHWRLDEKGCMQNYSIKPKWSLHNGMCGILNKLSL